MHEQQGVYQSGTGHFEETTYFTADCISTSGFSNFMEEDSSIL